MPYVGFLYPVTRFPAGTHLWLQLPRIWLGLRLQIARLHNSAEIIELILQREDERTDF